MKQYKGWEIAKMICEGRLKHGDYIIDDADRLFMVRSYHLSCEQDDFSSELGSSFLSSKNGLYAIVENPYRIEKQVSFDDVLKSDNKCRVEHDLVISTKEYEDFDVLIADISNVRDAQELRDIMLNGKWFIEVIYN